MRAVNLPSRDVMWPSHVRVEGVVMSIKDMYMAGSIVIEVRGCMADGWAAYMAPADQVHDNPDRMQQISPVFHRESGDTRKQLLARATELYGKSVGTSVCAFHPSREHWIYSTVEDPAKIEKDAQIAAAGVLVRYHDDFHGAIEWMETEISQAMYIAENVAFAPEVRANKRRKIVLTRAIEIVKEKQEAARETAANEYEQEAAAADIVAAHDAAIEEKKANAAPFSPVLVRITRKRFSTTQGEVLLEYDGQRIEQYGDQIELDGFGRWIGRNDKFWLEVAEREAIRRGLATPAITVIEHKAELVEQVSPEQLDIERRASGAAQHIAELQDEVARLTEALIKVDTLASGFHSTKQIRAWAAEENFKTKREITRVINEALHPSK